MAIGRMRSFRYRCEHWRGHKHALQTEGATEAHQPLSLCSTECPIGTTARLPTRIPKAERLKRNAGRTEQATCSGETTGNR